MTVSITPEQEQALREPFPPEEVGKLPRVSCGDCRQARAKVCDKHTKSKCAVCGNYITGAHIHLDYIGHAETTDRLLAVDPEWSWEPVAWTDAGMPAINRHGPNLVMWGRLTIAGVTRLGVGTAPADKDDAHKELIGDFLRNASMRFGVALDLWRKTERAEAATAHEEPVRQPQTAPVEEGTTPWVDPGTRMCPTLGCLLNEGHENAHYIEDEKPAANGAAPDVDSMTKPEIVKALTEAKLPTNGTIDALRVRLLAHVGGDPF